MSIIRKVITDIKDMQEQLQHQADVNRETFLSVKNLQRQVMKGLIDTGSANDELSKIFSNADGVRNPYNPKTEVPDTIKAETRRKLAEQIKASNPVDYRQIGEEIGELVNQKNEAYGDSFGKAGAFLELLYPDGIKPGQYADALCLVRIFDKQMRIATKKDAFGESPYRDITGYGLLGAVRDERSR